MAPPDPTNSALRLFEWLTGHGARLRGVAPQHVPRMGTGLVARTDLATEDEVLFVPRTVWLTRKTPHTSYRRVVDDPELNALFSHSMARTALVVALERETPDSFFREYLTRLGEPTVPYAMTPVERAALQGLPLATWIDDQHALAERESATLRARLETAFPEVRPTRALTPERWRWAYGHVMQRTFSVDIEDEEVWVLVPGVDFCNHANDPNATFYAEEDGWSLEASRTIRAGEQITIRYGRVKTSSDLLLYYGFVTPDNPNDRLHLQLELSPDDPDHSAKTEAIDVLGLTADALVGADGEIPSAFLHAAILWGLDSATFRADAPDVTAPERAIAALGRVAASLDDSLAAFATTLEDDLAAMEGPLPTGWFGPFIAYRANIKRLHRAAAASIRQRMDVIAADGWHPQDVVENDADGRYGFATVRVRA